MRAQFALTVANVGEGNFREIAPNGRYRMLVTNNDDHLCGPCAAETLTGEDLIIQVVYKREKPEQFCDRCREKDLAARALGVSA